MIPGAYAFGEEPLSSLAEAEDTSHGNPITLLLSDERAQLQFAMRTYGYNPATGEVEQVVFSSAGYSTIGDGEGAADGIGDHLHFPAALVSPYSVKVNLVSGGAWQASAIPGFGSVVIADPIGEFDYLKGYDLEGQRLTVWVGRRQWIGPSWSEFGRVFTGTVAALSWDLGVITLDIRDLREVLEVDANPDEYLGFGTGIRTTADGDGVLIGFAAEMDTIWSDPDEDYPFPYPSYFGGIIFKPEAPLRSGTVLDFGGLVQGRVYSDGAVGMVVKFTTGWKFVTSAPGLVAAGELHRLTLRVGGPLGAFVYLDGEVVASDSSVLLADADMTHGDTWLGRPA